MDTRPATESLRLRAHLAELGRVRRRVVAACADLSDEQRSVAELLTSELVANAVRHPERDDPGRDPEIVVKILHSHERLRVEVHDHDPRPLPPIHPPTTARETGMGLFLVHELASAWGCYPTPHRTGKVVWFELWPPGRPGAQRQVGEVADPSDGR